MLASSDRFSIKAQGEINQQALRKAGLKLLPTTAKQMTSDLTDTQHAWMLWVEQAQLKLNGQPNGSIVEMHGRGDIDTFV